MLEQKPCLHCGIPFQPRRKHTKYCCRSCSCLATAEVKREACRKGGQNSAATQKDSRRSKNEIEFGRLCKEKFVDVKFNEPIFNGWDADVIIEDLKIAVLWNGRWHYQQIAGHSLSQVQTRDKIKLEQIEKCGYKPYVVKDLGKHDVEFVRQEFEKFIAGIAQW